MQTLGYSYSMSIIKFPDHGHENTPQNKLDFLFVSAHIVAVSHVRYM